MLSKANIESDAGKEVKAKAIRDIKKAERRNQCYSFFVPPGNRDINTIDK